MARSLTDPEATLGILAGGSGVPCEIAEAVTRRGRRVHIVGLDGEAEPEIARFPHTWVNWAGVGAIIHAFRTNGCREVVIVGRVRRPNISRLRPDFGFLTSLPTLLGVLRGGDDAILRTVVWLFERHGIGIVGAQDVAPELLAPSGVLGSRQPTRADLAAIATCAKALAAVGPFDAAQAAVGAGDRLLAVEGADGTDAMLRRYAGSDRPDVRRMTTADGPSPAVLVKLPKPGQDRRIDLPAIGPETVRRAAAAGLAGIAVRTGETLIADRRAAIALADEAGLFVVGVADDGGEGARDDGHGAAPNAFDGLKPLAARTPGAGPRNDVELGARVAEALSPFWQRANVVVSRGYVLVTEGPGGAMAAAERAGRLKPWGSVVLRAKVGALVMTDIAGELGYDPGEIVRRARASGLAGIAILRSPKDEAALAVLRTAADTAGLFVLAPGDSR